MTSAAEPRPLCIYDGIEIPSEVSPAHVVPNALGGRKTSRRTVCTPCNGATSVQERELCEALRPFVGLIGVVRGDGKEGLAAVHEVEGIGRITVRAGQPKVTGTSINQVQNAPIPTFKVATPDLTKAAVQAAHLLRRTGKTPSDLQNGAVKFDIEERGEYLPPLPNNLALGGPDQFRALAKVAFELLAWHHPDVARSAPLRAAAEYIRYGNGGLDVAHDYVSPGSGIIDRGRFPSWANIVEIWSSGGKLLATVELLGTVRVSLTLADDWKGPPIALQYALDPHDGIILVDQNLREVPSALSDLSGRGQSSPQHAQAKFAELLAAVSKLHSDEAVARMAEDLFYEWQQTMPREHVITAEDVQRLADASARRMTGLILRLGESRPVDKAEFYKLVAKEFDRLEKEDEGQNQE